jgi:hypothetical protein
MLLGGPLRARGSILRVCSELLRCDDPTLVGWIGRVRYLVPMDECRWNEVCGLLSETGVGVQVKSFRRMVG